MAVGCKLSGSEGGSRLFFIFLSFRPVENRTRKRRLGLGHVCVLLYFISCTGTEGSGGGAVLR